MKEMSKFQLILTVIFGAFIVIGVIVFSVVRGGNKVLYKVTVWGSVPALTFNQVWSELPISKEKTIELVYVEKTSAQFDQDFIEALASGTGPDVFFLEQDSILKYKDKILVIPYSNYSARDFKNTFIQEGELYLDKNGIVALPFIVDPLVMYWNRDLFNNLNQSQPPARWSDFNTLVKSLTQKNQNLNIIQSTISFGEYGNVSNAKELISTLFMQWGNPITSVSSSEERVTSVLSGNPLNLPTNPSVAAINFYTQFANPAQSFYSWNRSMPSSKQFFLSNNLAVYFGFASELLALRDKNPNLNFDVATIPQLGGNMAKATFGKMIGLAITKNTKVASGAFQVVTILTDKDSVSAFSNALRLPPVRNDLLANKPASDAYMSVFYDSAIISKAWFDPNKSATALIFQEMIESITGGRAGVDASINKASNQINALLMKK